MGRRHAEPIEVRRRDDVPAQFLWRSRLYVVKDVLEHWFESGRWWASAPVRALAAGSDVVSDVAANSNSNAHSHSVTGLVLAPASIDDGEQEFWRVEAGAGRSTALGIYDLCFDWSRGGWQLVEVHD